MDGVSDSERESALLDVLYHSLAHPHRRVVLQFLSRHVDPVSVTKLAEVVAEWERDPPEDERARSREIAIGLHHVHLPKLAAAGFIERDEETGAVRLASDLAGVSLSSPITGLLDTTVRLEPETP